MHNLQKQAMLKAMALGILYVIIMSVILPSNKPKSTTTTNIVTGPITNTAVINPQHRNRVKTVYGPGALTALSNALFQVRSNIVLSTNTDEISAFRVMERSITNALK